MMGMTMKNLICADYQQFMNLASQPTKKISVMRALLHPRVAPVAWFRVANFCYSNGYHTFARIICQFIQLMFGAEIPPRAIIGPGLVLPHPRGVVIGSAEIGERVTLFQNVTLGARKLDGQYDLAIRPRLKNDVVVGTGATVLGSITIGEGATVAANSLVLIDVPAGCTAIGVPAKINSLGDTA